MKLSQLKKKYPKGFTQFNSFALYRYKNTKLNEDRDVRAEWQNITDFMDLQEIYIETINNADWRFQCVITWIVGVDNIIWANTKNCETRKEAETQGLDKLFEILEARL